MRKAPQHHTIISCNTLRTSDFGDSILGRGCHRTARDAEVLGHAGRSGPGTRGGGADCSWHRRSKPVGSSIIRNERPDTFCAPPFLRAVSSDMRSHDSGSGFGVHAASWTLCVEELRRAVLTIFHVLYYMSDVFQR